MSRRVPEVRFAGFSGDWEERKLKDNSTIIGGTRGNHQNIIQKAII